MGLFIVVGIVIGSLVWQGGGSSVVFSMVVAYLFILADFSIQPFFGLQFSEGVFVDNFGVLMAVITLVVGVLTLLCSHNEFSAASVEPKKGSEVSILLTLMCCLFMFVSGNWMWFYIWFEASVIPIMWLILMWGYQPERFEASLYMALYTVGGSLPLLVSLIYLMFNNHSDSFVLGKLSFDFWLLGASLSWVCVFSLIFGFLVKAPLFGVHGWLPNAHVEAPLAGSMLLSGVLLKLGGYGLYRIMWLVNLNNGDGGFVIYMVMSVGLVGGCLCTAICACQSDLKAMVAFSSIGHIGFCVCGLLSGTSIGVGGAAAVMFAHGIVSPILFALCGALYDGSSTRSVGLNLGLDGILPGFSFLWGISWFVNMGVPLTLNYVGEWILIGSIKLVIPHLLAIAWLMCFLNGVVSFYAFSAVGHGSGSGFSRSFSVHVNERYFVGSVFGLVFLFVSPFCLDFFTV